MSERARTIPRFSVVVPAYNAQATVISAVRSVLAQTRPNLEVIVVDDGSTDATAEVVKRIDDDRVRLISQSNLGLPAARNAGVTAARGEYISLLDSDDLFLPRYLERSERALRSTADAGFAYTDAYVFDAVSGRVRRRSAMARSNPPSPPPADANGFLLALLKSNFVYVSTTIPRRVLEAVGGFDEARGSSEDYELWLRIVLNGYRAVWMPGREALYRRHPGQMSRQLVTMSRNLLAVYDGLQMTDMPTAAHRALLTRRRRAARFELRVVSPLAALVPLGWVGAIKRAGVGEAWYETPPPEVRAAFPDLTAV
jgi:glycosyltransferase involved in cell wall biosynthesis